MSSPAPLFLDACIPMYAAGTDHPYKGPCLRVLEAVAMNRLQAATSAEVIQEIAYHYWAVQRRADGLLLAKEFGEAITNVLPVTRQDALRSLELLQVHAALPPRDAIHIAVMEAAGLRCIITADRHFDGLPGIKRVDPMDLAW